jgi:DNA-binding transcriptional regulator YiaG
MNAIKSVRETMGISQKELARILDMYTLLTLHQ